MAATKYTFTAAHKENIRRGMRALRSPETRFWAKVEKRDDCWWWTGSVRGGYGEFVLNGGKVAAHRFSFEQANGAIAAGLKVCHRCDNPLCVRPDHLFVGTQSENIKDMYAKGRGAKRSAANG